MVTKKEGHDYAGMLLSLLLAILSDRGREIMLVEKEICTTRIEDQVHMIELILGMEEWLKAGSHTYEEVKHLPNAIDDFITKINHCCQREGMGTKLIKNHLYFHIPKYIELWGPPKGWDSAPNESHHKTELKAPSKNTQQIPSTLIRQTAKRHCEVRLVHRSRSHFKLDVNLESNSGGAHRKSGAKGSKFEVKLDEDNSPTMVWNEQRRRKGRAFHPEVVLTFCCEKILPIVKSTSIYGFTEYKRKNPDPQTDYLFRSHPSYRATTGQNNAVWYDWALFNVNDKHLPCQIMCLLDIGDLVESDVDHQIQGYGIEGNCLHAVVRCFKTEPRVIRDGLGGATYSELVTWGKLHEKLFLFPCNNIISDVAVVQNRTYHKESTNSHVVAMPAKEGWFVVKNRNEWHLNFRQYIMSFAH